MRAAHAKLGTPAPAGVEPVAWRVARNKDEYELFFNKQMAERRAECFIRRPTVEPLYTADQVLAMERVPLTDEQIKGLIEEGAFFGNCKEIVRAIEAAHGIKGGQQ